MSLYFNARKQAKVFLGIDFGTFQSVAALKKEGSENEPFVLKANSYQNLRTIYWHSDAGEVKVCGDVINEQYHINDPSHVKTSVKMLLEDKESNKVAVGNSLLTAESIIEPILRYIFEFAQQQLQRNFVTSVDGICVGVPNAFKSSARSRLKKLIEKIGYSCELLAEPQAAALYYVYASRITPTMPIMVLDMGAGTYDVSILTRNTGEGDEPFEIIDNDYSKLAGDKLDEVTLEMVEKKLIANGYNGTFPPKGSNGYLLLLDQARMLKEQLSMKKEPDEPQVRKFDNGTEHYPTVSITRREFEQAILPTVISPNIEIAKKLVSDNALEGREIKIVMVGGSSNIPLLRAEVIKAFPWIAEEDVLFAEPDNAVAMGCALYAEEPPFKKTVKHAYGFKVQVSADDELGSIEICIPSNAALPYSKRLHYETLWERQTGVQFDLYEVTSGALGDRIPCSRGYSTKFSVLHMFKNPMPEHSPVDACVTLNSDGIIELQIKDADGHMTRETKELTNGEEV